MRLTAIVVWNDDPRTGCVASCPELGVEAEGADPMEARAALKREALDWMSRQEGAIPLKAIVSEFEVPIPPESKR